MKKRLLITSIVMMLVVAVALSTATYAWFTSNNTVTGTAVTMTAHVADASSITIGWEGGSSSTELVAVGGDALYPICPTALTSTNASTIAFNRADVNSEGTFDAPITSGDTVLPYTWISAASGGKDAFYINNDSPAQAVSIAVTATIKDIITVGQESEALADDVVLNPGKTYYTWAENPAESGLYVATAISANAYSDGETTVASAKTNLLASAIYDKKPVGKYIRVAIFASSAKNTKDQVLAKTEFGYKGMLGYGGDGSTNDTAMGTITQGGTPATLVGNKAASSSSVTVIDRLAGNQAVYLVVKVWIDGQSFTQAEGLAKASVELTFTASNVS